jgi:cyclic pyranopterin phosphate synthase
MSLTHLNDAGEAHMVDVGAKADTHRVAEARAIIEMSRIALDAIASGHLKKGDALGTARIAGIMAAKRTGELIPLCHPIALTKVEVRLEPASNGPNGRGEITIHTRVECVGKTGVEMEALTSASVAALTVYDMAKALDRGMVIREVRLVSKRGGKSGDWQLDEAAEVA